MANGMSLLGSGLVGSAVTKNRLTRGSPDAGRRAGSNPAVIGAPVSRFSIGLPAER